MQPVHIRHAVQQAVGQAKATLGGRVLRQVQQYRAQHPILARIGQARRQAGGVLARRQQARRLAGGAVLGQHVDARPTRRALGHGVGVYRHEQVGLVLVRHGGALAQFQEPVVAAREHGAHARLGVDLRGQFPGDGQGDGFLVQAAGADGTHVVAAVAGVDHHRHGAGRLGAQHRRTGGDRGRCFGWLGNNR